MDGRGDGEHVGPNRPEIYLYPRGEQPTANQLSNDAIDWLNVQWTMGVDAENYTQLMYFLQHGEGPNDNEVQGIEDGDDILVIDEDEHVDHGAANDYAAPVGNDSDVVIIDDSEDDDIDDNNNDNSDNISVTEENNEDPVNNDDFCNNALDDSGDVSDENAEDADLSGQVDFYLNVEEADTLLEGYRIMSRKDEELRLWAEFDDTDNDKDVDSYNSGDNDETTVKSPVKNTGYESNEDAERDQPSKHERDDKRINQKSCYKLCDNFDTSTNIDAANTNVDVAKDDGAVCKDVNQPLEEEPTEPKPRKRSRKRKHIEPNRDTLDRNLFRHQELPSFYYDSDSD
ncbi:hypothetical protein JOB18_026960 [Solea senegalensis]|uniref:Uncharacterized protein n=1 Tax=Solea senegalensis TaxID=28829 RepID=A0AAV6QU49_SOLSE|nr:hypothetical protein JOB18_026960 [Solea senegalensis]